MQRRDTARPGRNSAPVMLHIRQPASDPEPLMDTLILSRLQFAANISFHIRFLTITIAAG